MYVVDSEKKRSPNTSTSMQAIKRSSNNPYAHLVGLKFYRCQEVGHTLDQCRATKPVNLVDGGNPDDVFEDDDASEAFLGLVRRLVLTGTKKSEDNQRCNIFQTQCKINQDVFNVFIDGGSSENIILWDIVARLKLTPKKHRKHCKIGWIKAVGKEDLGNST
ncbi:hypothetical protein CTI12_AA005040 [Artemisia annua]|uniref:Uncharacterized protein n=1 Tax=Artemisia annua TaxID=35608 RepID=A0A2U1QLP4_ARTAN|nr:hypothetical protein CTI12_AA005040 [Artemisia annua]